MGKRPVPGSLTDLDNSKARAIVLAVGVGGVVWTFFLSSIISLFSSPLWETARYRLKYCLKGPLKSNQPTNKPTNQLSWRSRLSEWINLNPKMQCSMMLAVLTIFGTKTKVALTSVQSRVRESLAKRLN